MEIDFWFDFASTYSYPSAMRIDALAKSRGINVRWRPFLLGAIFNEQGLNDSPFNIYPVKGRYMWRDLERLCDSMALPFRRPSQFPRNGLLAARVACWHAEADWLPAFVRNVYSANFRDDLDISDPVVLKACLTAAGQDAEALFAQAQSPASKERLRAQTAQASELGIFGAPFFMVGQEPFWGNDRLEQALAWCGDHVSP
ncbi:MAG: 2-hydroxychromene-2-carboxylate isomerase [Pseudomonadota bacterium]